MCGQQQQHAAMPARPATSKKLAESSAITADPQRGLNRWSEEEERAQAAEECAARLFDDALHSLGAAGEQAGGESWSPLSRREPSAPGGVLDRGSEEVQGPAAAAPPWHCVPAPYDEAVEVISVSEADNCNVRFDHPQPAALAPPGVQLAEPRRGASESSSAQGHPPRMLAETGQQAVTEPNEDEVSHWLANCGRRGPHPQLQVGEEWRAQPQLGPRCPEPQFRLGARDPAMSDLPGRTCPASSTGLMLEAESVVTNSWVSGQPPSFAEPEVLGGFYAASSQQPKAMMSGGPGPVATQTDQTVRAMQTAARAMAEASEALSRLAEAQGLRSPEGYNFRYTNPSGV